MTGEFRAIWEGRLVAPLRNKDDDLFFTTLSGEVLFKLFSQVPHLHTNDVVIEGIEIFAPAKDPKADLKFGNGFLGVDDRMTNNKKKDRPKLRGT